APHRLDREVRVLEERERAQEDHDGECEEAACRWSVHRGAPRTSDRVAARVADQHAGDEQDEERDAPRGIEDEAREQQRRPCVPLRKRPVGDEGGQQQNCKREGREEQGDRPPGGLLPSYRVCSRRRWRIRRAAVSRSATRSYLPVMEATTGSSARVIPDPRAAPERRRVACTTLPAR